VDPISTGLAGIALVQKSVDFIKSNIQTANDIRDIAGAIDGMFQGEKQIQKERFGNKSIIGQTKDAASTVIDAKLAKEQMDEMRQLVDHRDTVLGKRLLMKELNVYKKKRKLRKKELDWKDKSVKK
jgi:hypothetical protein